MLHKDVRLRVEIMKRKALEEALHKKERHFNALLKESHRMQVHLRHLSHQILLAQEEERKEISRELHDDIAQVLTSINVRLASLKLEATRDAKGLKGKIAHTQRLVKRSVEIVHRFARELRPALLDNLGLNPALRAYVQQYIHKSGIPVQFTAVSAVDGLTNRKQTVLYRVAQEALTNVARHAHAHHVTIRIKKVREVIVMEIHDDGNAFDVQILATKKFKRLGLIGMRERMEMVGGSFTIESLRGKGTTIQASLPLSGGRLLPI
jgi:signal transduction histidine kinase